jgi:hypothetical protein
MTKFILELQFWKHTLNINTQIIKKTSHALFLPNPMIIKDTRTHQKNVDQNIVYIFDLFNTPQKSILFKAFVGAY